MQSLATEIQGKITSAPRYSPHCCIYRVPPLLRRTNEQAYTPSLVSIGPLHHNHVSPLPMDPHKITFLRSFLRDSSANADLNSYLNIVSDMETHIRACYAVPIHLSTHDFIQMVLIDSAFIIQYLRLLLKLSLAKHDFEDILLCCRYLPPGVLRDIKLLENQLPFCVLVKLYRTAFKPSVDPLRVPSFTELACRILGVEKSKLSGNARTNEANCCHLLDLLRSNYKPKMDSSSQPPHPKTGHISIDMESIACPTATSLYAAGIKFRAIPSGSNSSGLLDICFDESKGILNIPKLQVEDNTEYLFRNLMAFEECHRTKDVYFRDYHYFLDTLLNTPEDVHLFANEGIVENFLGSHKQVSNLVNSLGEHITINKKYYRYKAITQQLNNYQGKCWNRNRAILNQKYFQHPWATMSVIYAMLLLLLTLIQVVAGILAIPNVLIKP